MVEDPKYLYELLSKVIVGGPKRKHIGLGFLGGAYYGGAMFFFQGLAPPSGPLVLWSPGPLVPSFRDPCNCRHF